MFSAKEIDHANRNQKNYHEKAKDHDTLSLASTLYLAYRDINVLLNRHLYSKIVNNNIRLLDFGCGVGLSTEIVLNHISKHTQYTVDTVGVDINASNLEIARKKLPQAQFKCITAKDNLEDIGHFDLIICNFVLVEMKNNEMLDVLNLLKTKLSKNGILIVTNPNAKAYHPENQWYTFNNQFPENIPTLKLERSDKLTYHQDQPIKVQVFAEKDSPHSFTFFDYFHSGSQYRNAYLTAGLQLLETHKPLGTANDQIEWKAEYTKSPYKIHVLGA